MGSTWGIHSPGSDLGLLVGRDDDIVIAGNLTSPPVPLPVSL